MAEEVKTTVPKTGENMTIDDLDKVLTIHKLNRLGAQREDLTKRLADLSEITDEKKLALDEELKVVEDTDSKGDDVIQKALDETIVRIKKDLALHADKENINNIIGIIDSLIQRLTYFGC